MTNKDKSIALTIYHGDLSPLCPVHMNGNCKWKFTSTPIGKILIGIHFKCGTYYDHSLVNSKKRNK